MINEERIKINQQKIESYKQDIIQGDCIVIDNEEHIVPRIEEKKSEIVMFHKPLGFVVSKNDPHNKTIYEILPEKFKSWYYIGRLDKNSSGLLLLTNDTAVVNQYEHPKFAIEKEYLVEIKNKLTYQEMKKIEKWITDEWELLNIVLIEPIEATTYRIILNEGKKRHIRRIFKRIRNYVVNLQRIREWEFFLGDLKVGEYKKIK